MIDAVVRSPFSIAVGWALFHSLWQGALAAALVALARPGRARYTAGCLALAALVLSFGVTGWICFPDEQQGANTRLRFTAASAMFPAGVDAGARVVRSISAANVLPWLALVWLTGVCILLLRMAVGWRAAAQFSRRGVCVAPAAWRARVGELAARLGVSDPISLVESGLARGPVVAGHLRPIIIVPAGFLTALPTWQVEAILLHELAHIRRQDYLANMLQSVAEALLFHQPAVWWISSVVSAEREHCCDELAVSAMTDGGTYEYARALAALEQSRWGGDGGTEPAALMAAKGGILVKRVERLLFPHRTAVAWNGAAWILAALAIAGVWQAVDAAPPGEAYEKWLNEDVVYIIDNRERDAYRRLKTDDERRHFIEQFWQRRDPTAGTPQNEFKEEHYRRIAYSNDRFRSPKRSGWRTDRGRIYIVYGPPDEIESHPSGRAGGPPFEQWLYSYLEGIGKRVIVDFVDTNRDGEFQQSKDPSQRR